MTQQPQCLWKIVTLLVTAALVSIAPGCSTPTATPSPVKVTLAPTLTPSLMSTNTPAHTPTTVPTSTATFTPTPTVTLAPTETVTPTLTPKPKPESLLPQASQICAQAFNKPVVNETVFAPIFTLVDHGDGTWAVDKTYSNPLLEADTADEVKALLCVQEIKREAGHYDDGSTGYRISVKLRVVALESGQPVLEKTFAADPLPATVYVDRTTGLGTGDVISRINQAAYNDWLLAYFPVDTHFQHPAVVKGVAFSPDGNFLAVTGEDSSARVWDLSKHQAVYKRTGANQGLLSGGSPVFLPDGSALILGEYMKPAQVISAANWRPSRTIFSNQEVSSFAIHPDGSKLAASVGYGPASIQIMDWKTQEMLSEIPVNAMVQKLVYSSDGQILVAMLDPYFMDRNEAEEGIRVWDTADGRLIFRLGGGEYGFRGTSGFSFGNMALTPDGKYLVVAKADSKGIEVFDIQDGELIKTLVRDDGAVLVTPRTLAVSPDGKLLACGTNQGVLTIWDTQTWQPVHASTDHGAIQALAFSSDGGQLAIGVYMGVELMEIGD